MKTYSTFSLLACAAVVFSLCGARTAEAQTYGSIAPYTTDAYTVLLDHFDGSTSAGILAYTHNGGTPCGSAWPSADPSSAYVPGPTGLDQAQALYPPAGSFTTLASYLKYPGGELLTQANGTLECWVYLTNYLFAIHQFTYPGECEGDVGGISLNSTGQLQATIFYTPTAAFSLDSGPNNVPLNTWTHVALSWGSAGARLYINGVMVGTNANTGGFTHWPSGANSVYCMASSGAASGADSGYVDELRISSIQRTNFNLPCATCPPSVDLKMFAGVIINGPIGSNYNVQSTSPLGTPNWMTLTNVTLQTSPYIFIDYRSPTNVQQFYRVNSP